MGDIFTVLQHQIVIVLIQRLPHKGFFNTVHKDFERRAVKERVVDIKEEISCLLCLKDPAAEQLAAYDLEGVDQGVLHIFQFKFRQMLYMKLFKDLG